ncbi:MAG: RES family NAD+ phosphorylase [Pseudomonadales bacterium]
MVKPVIEKSVEKRALRDSKIGTRVCPSKADINFTRSIGDEWLSAGNSTLLKTPSAIVPNSYNYLFNPRHPEAQVAIITTITTHPYDQRLLS